MASPVTVGLIQMSMSTDPKKNLEKALLKIEEAAAQGAQIVCLPELFLAPYFCQRKDDEEAKKTVEPLPGPTTKILSQAAAEHGIVLVGGSIYEEGSDGKLYNTTPVFNPDGKMLGTYRKTHIPEDILYHEQHYFEPGNTGVKVFDTAFGKVAPLICYDQWYPEIARQAALAGAELIVYPTAIGVVDSDVEENITGDWDQMWRHAMLGHAATNNVYVAAINRVGKEGSINFWGGSFISDPSALVMVRAGNTEEVILAKCDFGRVIPLQKAWRFFENRRPKTYDSLTRSP